MLEFAGKGELYKQLYKAKGGFTEERSGRVRFPESSPSLSH